MIQRRCSKPSCSTSAVATLTYVYADCTAVLGPLSTAPEPHCYDLCASHAEKLTVPLGWEVLRLELDSEPLGPDHDDLIALADAVRSAGSPSVSIPVQESALIHRSVDLTDDHRAEHREAVATGRGHLRVLPDPS